MEEIPVRQVDLVSVAIEINKEFHLHKINKLESLDQVIETLRYSLGLPKEQKYALQFDKRNAFVTEKNRHEIKDGAICHLVYSPEVLARTILGRLHERWALRKLLDFVADETLIEQLQIQEGVAKIVDLLQEESLPGEVQELAFQVVAELFMQDKLPVEWLRGRILDRVFSHVSGDRYSSGNTVAACLRICLILYNQGAVKDEVPIDKLSMHFESTSLQVQEAALALFNTRVDKEGPPERKLLLKVRDQLHDTIDKHYLVLHKDFLQHLTHFQARLMTRLVKKFESIANLEDAAVQRRLSELAKEEASRTKRDTFTESTLRLLAEFVVPPPEGVPPSLLLLDCLTHSVRNQIQHLPGSLMENQPFLHLCNQFVRMLMEALNMLTGQAPLHPVLFNDRAFEEMFCACIRTLNKTCKEMRAKGDDLSKILAVHAKKLGMALDKKPLHLVDYEKSLSAISYADVWEAWHEEERLKQENMFRNNLSFLELREQLRPQYEKMVRLQRLGVLTQGATFKKYPSKPNHQHIIRSNKDREWTVKYYQKTNSLEFKDSEEKFNDFSIDVSQIKNVLEGSNCPHAKIKNAKQNPAFALSINLTTADPEFLNLGASSAKEKDYWYDGIRMLLEQPLVSESYTTELEDLLDMHLKLHLLELDDIVFPDGPPPKVPEMCSAIITVSNV